MKYVLLTLSIVLLASCRSNSSQIVKNGNSNYEIVIGANSSAKIQEAATELQHYLNKATGVQLPVVNTLSAGKKAMYLQVKESATPYIHYHNDKGQLTIKGSDEMYLSYAVYEFLERELKCRFWAPDAERVPAIEQFNIAAQLNYHYSPPVHVRTVHSKLFYENAGFADKQRVSYEAFPMYAPNARVHTFHRFVPADTYFKTHPEYFALVDGERRSTQLCLSNADVLNLVKEAVRQCFKEHPEASVVSVSQDDNTQYCQCDKCEAIHQEEGSPSATMIRFVNEVALAFPDKTISTLAYQYTRKACKTKPLDNVLITLCSIECDRSAPIEDKCSDFAEDLQAWKLLTENIRIWDYTTQFTNFLAPFPNIYTLEPNLRFFADNNARWIFEQHSHNPSELFELRSYLMARLLWDPSRNTDVLIREFCEGYYGAAGSEVVEYITKIHDELANDDDFFLFLYGGPSQAFNSFLRPDALDVYNRIFDQAEQSVANHPDLLTRVRRARLGVRYATLEACRANLSSKYSLSNRGFVQSELAAFEGSCAEGGIEMMNETRFMVSDYLELSQRNLARSSAINMAGGQTVKLLTKPHKYADEDPQVLTDGAYGGGSFYASWLGFEGNDLEAIVDLGEIQAIENVSCGFLQVVNHVVFFPLSVTYYSSTDGKDFKVIKRIENERPLNRESKINDTQLFECYFPQTKARYIKVVAKNRSTAPGWHHAVGLPSWIFADEIQVR